MGSGRGSWEFGSLQSQLSEYHHNELVVKKKKKKKEMEEHFSLNKTTWAILFVKQHNLSNLTGIRIQRCPFGEGGGGRGCHSNLLLGLTAT